MFQQLIYHVIIFTDLTDTVLTAKPLGAYKIASSLRAVGYKCLVVDNLSTWSEEDITVLLKKVMSSHTLFVGFSTTFLQSINNTADGEYLNYEPNVSIFPQGQQFENKIIGLIKEINPICKIVLGGHKVNPNCSNKNIDIIVRGLSEVSIVNLTKSLEQQSKFTDSYKNIFGINIVYKDQEKEYDFSNSPMLWEPTDIVNYQVLPLEPARGCIFNCKFCSFPQRGKKTLDYLMNPEILYNELLNNYKLYGTTTYQLLDDTFNDSDYKLDSILDIVKQLPFQPIFWAFNRLDLMAAKPERIQKMFDIGLRATSFGIETLKKETGVIVGKGFDPKKQIEAVQSIRKRYGNELLMHGLFIIGLPHESLDEVQKTFDLIYSGELPLHSAYFETLFIAKPNELWIQSDFDKNWQNYGYEDIGTPSTSRGIHWKNDLMTMEQANAKKKEFFDILFKDDRFYIPGQTAWALMNYKNFDLQKIQNLKNTRIDWHEVTLAKKDFFEDYKKKLFEMLDINNDTIQ